MRRVLIIEDDMLVRDMYSYVFKKNGYTMIEAVDGEDGTAKAKQERVDIILLDIMLPKKNGIEVLKEIRMPESPAFNTPVIVLTNLGDDTIINEALKLGADGYILKADFIPQEVFDKVNDFLEGRVKKEDLRPQT